MKTYVIGDIHGRVEALKKVLVDSNFDYKKDKLIVLGDVVDGGKNSFGCVEELLKIKNLVYVIGNHDFWFISFIKDKNLTPSIWLHQGGCQTLKSYKYKYKVYQSMYDKEFLVDIHSSSIPQTHKDFFSKGVYYHELNNMLFVHGGFDVIKKINEQEHNYLMWDRELINYAKHNNINSYKKVFIGHTTTQLINDITKPIKFNNLIMLDCGAGWNGKLALMNIETEEFWLSEKQKPIR